MKRNAVPKMTWTVHTYIYNNHKCNNYKYIVINMTKSGVPFLTLLLNREKNVQVVEGAPVWINSVDTFICVTMMLLTAFKMILLFLLFYWKHPPWNFISRLTYPIILNFLKKFFDLFPPHFSKPRNCWNWGPNYYHLTRFSLVENGWEPWTRLLANCTSASICFPAVSTEAKTPSVFFNLPYPMPNGRCWEGNLETAFLSSLQPQTKCRHLYSILHCKILQLLFFVSDTLMHMWAHSHTPSLLGGNVDLCVQVYLAVPVL